MASFALGSPIEQNFFSSALSAIMDPFVEAELFNDAAHVALDLTQFLGPATVAIRLFAVLGRIFCITSDYLPDHAINPEELVFQFTMLALASTAFGQSLNSIVLSYGKELTMRDRKCFASLFYPGGVSWMQYKMLTASVLEWEEVAPGSVITSDEFEIDLKQSLYWLYSGEATVEFQGRVLQEVVPKTVHLFGDLTFAPNKGRKKLVSAARSYPKTTMRAGAKGAKVLRINTPKLQTLMEQDDSLDRAIREILLEAMQERIAMLLANAK
eukprot:CAMPEP_0194209986 /NCGR_PEP_ID=MMETSP0156-20130528/7925_1 /TAXON_ID=33649 /ORGANISM="Thalassionema nitzschioides, Strain L26-B" /LENGTH=268 /DNA_ID=CAMNT_0038937259 /DNA_START=313 /DNA_END=1119 /DNA_ORIENTATION=-